MMLYITLHNQDPTNNAFIDLTRRFPYRSSRGNEYVLIGYYYDANAIQTERLKSRHSWTINEVWKILNDNVTIAGVNPNTYMMKNEASWDLKNSTKEKDIAYQLVSPYIHHTNLKERAIQTFKLHFMLGLASLNPYFTLSEWYRMIPHAELTFNLLRAARSNKNSQHGYTYLDSSIICNAGDTPMD